jgi:pimeloyl-ACP methyl ester carboxylesterase
MSDITPFRFRATDADISDLHRRLDHARWPAQLAETSWESGVPTQYLQQLSSYWRHRFDWRAQEARLNALPQFTTDIDGQRIHFIHARSAEPDAVPLLITHGWPGSVIEFLDIIEPLRNPRAFGGDPRDAFHVIAPSLPGFGFSTPLSSKGWNLARIARAWSELMQRLGYEQYFAQGGDAGAGIATELSHCSGGRLRAIHMNGPLLFPSGDPEETKSLAPRDQERLRRLQQFQSEGMGYYQIQATRPQTLAYGLTDSPVALLAWIVEKFKEWTDPAKELPQDAVKIDDLLANVSLYWFTGSAGSAARLLYETTHAGGWPQPPTVPVGVAVFAGDNTLRAFVERGGPGHLSEFDAGGHFASMECPQLLVSDIRKFFRSLRNEM